MIKINYNNLIETAYSYQEFYIDEKHITCLNRPVCSTTGEEIEIDPHLLHGKSFQESINILYNKYSGDIIILVEEGSDFAIIRPPFSEFVVFYFYDKNSIELWSGYYLP